MDRNVKLIISSRFLLSFSYGFLNVIVSLYLYYLGYSYIMIGIILGIALILNAIFALLFGMVADHYGRKLTLVILFLVFSISSFLYLYINNFLILAFLAGLAGFTGSGGGPIGSGGPFGAVQTAIITETTEPKRLSEILGIASIIGLIGSMLGSAFVYLIENIHFFLYNLFYIASIMGILAFIISLFVKDNKIRSRSFLPKISYKNIIKLSLPTIPGGFGNGFVTPILSLWFHERYGVSAGIIGLVMSTGLFATIIAMYVFPYLTRKYGDLRIIVLTRTFASILLILIALSPYFILSAIFLIFRQAFQMGAIPVRQSFSMKNVHESERATTSGATSLARTGSSSPSIVISGYLMQFNLEFPFFLGGIVSIFDPILYYILFKEQFGRV